MKNAISMWRERAVFPIAVAAVLVTAVPAATQDHDKSQAGERRYLVSTEWLAQRLDDRDLRILHVDTRRDRFESSHIPGASFVDYRRITWAGEGNVSTEIPPLADLVPALEEAGADDDLHLVIYSADPRTAARLWFTLDYLGHGGHASLLDGGLTQWLAEDRPTATGPEEPSPGRLTANARDDVVVSAEWILDRMDDRETLLVDARPLDEYTGDDGGMGGRANPGHIPGAHHLAWDRLITSTEAPTLLPADSLRALFEQHGAQEDDTLVTYCMVGYRASLTYFVARSLGYHVKMYDGSWHDWGTRDLPYVGGEDQHQDEGPH